MSAEDYIERVKGKIAKSKGQFNQFSYLLWVIMITYIYAHTHL